MSLSAGTGHSHPAVRNLIASLIAGLIADLIADLIAGVIASVIAGDILYDTTAIPKFCYFCFEKWEKVNFNLPSFKTADYSPL